MSFFGGLFGAAKPAPAPAPSPAPAVPAAGGGGGGAVDADEQLREAQRHLSDLEATVEQSELKKAGYQEKAQAAAARGDLDGAF
jgi:hypothetical protein